jgi:putative salt-induced outer membrane protein YdiY
MNSARYMLAGFSCLAAMFASGDEVIFKSGDRLTGTIKSVADGKMAFVSKVAGPLTLKMEDVKTFSTEAPIEIALKDGTTVQQKVSAAGDGQVAVQPGGAAQTLALDSVAKINPEKPRWKGAVTAGATLVRGNTESTTVTLGAEATRRTDNDRISLGAGYYFAKQRDNTTRDDSTITDNWFLKGQYDHFFTKQFYAYGNLKYEKDRIANLDIRLTPGAGFGYQWVESKAFNFSTEGGGTWVYEKYADPTETRTYMGGRLAYHLDKALNEHVKAIHNTEYIPSFERVDTFLVNTDVGLRAALTANLALDAKAQMAYNSQPAEGRDKRDLRYVVGLGWTF